MWCHSAQHSTLLALQSIIDKGLKSTLDMTHTTAEGLYARAELKVLPLFYYARAA